MSVKQVRNKNYIPCLEVEGYFEKHPPEPTTYQEAIKPEQIELWSWKLTPYERMFYHHTLSSTRRIAKFQNHEYTFHKYSC